MVTNCWLVNAPIKLINNIVHTQPTAAQVPHYFLARFVSQCFCKEDSIHVCHTKSILMRIDMSTYCNTLCPEFAVTGIHQTLQKLLVMVRYNGRQSFRS